MHTQWRELRGLCFNGSKVFLVRGSWESNFIPNQVLFPCPHFSFFPLFSDKAQNQYSDFLSCSCLLAEVWQRRKRVGTNPPYARWGWGCGRPWFQPGPDKFWGEVFRSGGWQVALSMSTRADPPHGTSIGEEIGTSYKMWGKSQPQGISQ